MNKALIAASASALLLSVAIAWAQPPATDSPPFGAGPHFRGMGPGMGPRWEADDDDDLPGICADLGLTQEQQAKLEKMRLEHHKAMVDVVDQMRATRLALRKAVIADKYDGKSVADIAAKLGKLAEQAAKIRTDHLRQVRDLLTDEQRVRFDQRILSFHAGKGCGPGGPHGRSCMGQIW